jgi:hypothetical protein
MNLIKVNIVVYKCLICLPLWQGKSLVVPPMLLCCNYYYIANSDYAVLSSDDDNDHVELN